MNNSAAQERRRLRNNRRWRNLSKAILAENPVCAVCGAPATAVDHIQHDDDNSRFYDRDNLRPICLPCNSRKSVDEANLSAHRRRKKGEGGRPQNCIGGRTPHPEGEFYTQAKTQALRQPMAEAIRRKRGIKNAGSQQ